MDRDSERERDNQLVLAGLNGSEQALQALVTYYQKPIYNVAYKILHDADASADATQSTFLLAFEKLHTFDTTLRFFSWIYRIAVNESLDQGKKRAKTLHLVSDESIESNEVGPLERIDNNETDISIRRILMMLQEDHRTVLTLRHYSDLSYSEISEILNIPIKTVRSRLYSARQMMKEHLNREGFFSA